jgi:hypothetical protein
VEQEDPVPPGPLSEFAQGLRSLRLRAPGPPSYEELAARAGWPVAALVDAAGGSYLPTLEVTLAFVAVCGGDLEEWRERWSLLHASLRAPDANPPTVELPPVPSSDGAQPPVEEPIQPGELIAGVEAGAVAPLQRDDPRRIGQYRLLGRLGTGAMGRVYLGVSKGRRPVAVRAITADLSGDRTFRERFAAEISAARRVRGPHTPFVMDADPWAEDPWVATAYVPGPTLAEAIAAEGPLPTRLVWTLAAAVAEALQAHHKVGVRHRVLKPGNILLSTDGPQVLDFGLARAVDVSRLVATGYWESTAPFLSPEQVEGRQAASAADVFALGSVLAYAATGIPPFGDGSSGDMLQRIAGAEPYPAALNIEDPRLRGLITACLDQDPFCRPTPEEILDTCAGNGLPAHRLPPVIVSRVAHDDAEVSGIVAAASRRRNLARLKFGAVPALVAAVVVLSTMLISPGKAGHTTAAGPGHPGGSVATAPPTPVIGSATASPPASGSAMPSMPVSATGKGTPAGGSPAAGNPSAAMPSSAASAAGFKGAGACRGTACFGKDPFAAGCSSDGVVLYRLGTSTGVLEEWYSPSCQASWARIFDSSPGTWFYVQTCYNRFYQVFTVRTGFTAGYTFMIPGGGPTIRVGDLQGYGPC